MGNKSDVYVANLVAAAAKRKERTQLANRRLREAALREVQQVGATWSVDTQLTISDKPRRGRTRTVKMAHAALAGVTGACTRCHREFPAIGLVAVDQYVPVRGEHVWRAPTDDNPLGGRWEQAMRHIIGWFCAGCRPRNFGRLNGGPNDGWVERPTDGSSIDPPKADEGMGRLLKPMGQAGDGPRRTVKHRSRKPKAMKPLG